MPCILNVEVERFTKTQMHGDMCQRSRDENTLSCYNYREDSKRTSIHAIKDQSHILKTLKFNLLIISRKIKVNNSKIGALLSSDKNIT